MGDPEGSASGGSGHRSSAELIGDPEPDDIETLAVDADREAWADTSAVSRLGGYAVPVAMAHLAFLFLVLQAWFGFRLPAFVHAPQVAGWLWMNGAAVGAGFWMWRSGRAPVGARKWLTGRRVKWSVAAWLLASLAWFLVPALVEDAWRALAQALRGG